MFSWLGSNNNLEFNNIDKDTIFLVDNDVDHSQSLFKQLVTSSKDAFSRPSLICKYINDIPDDKIAGLSIPTGIPLIYELDEGLKPTSKYYLRGD